MTLENNILTIDPIEAYLLITCIETMLATHGLTKDTKLRQVRYADRATWFGNSNEIQTRHMSLKLDYQGDEPQKVIDTLREIHAIRSSTTGYSETIDRLYTTLVNLIGGSTTKKDDNC